MINIKQVGDTWYQTNTKLFIADYEVAPDGKVCISFFFLRRNTLIYYSPGFVGIVLIKKPKNHAAELCY
jgi:hypothetical protein